MWVGLWYCEEVFISVGTGVIPYSTAFISLLEKNDLVKGFFCSEVSETIRMLKLFNFCSTKLTLLRRDQKVQLQ